MFYTVFYISLLTFTAGIACLWRYVILDTDSPKYSGPVDGLAYTPGMFPIS